MSKESDHTPKASTNIDAQGEDNLTQPSGEQPTSVEVYELIDATIDECVPLSLLGNEKLKADLKYAHQKAISEERRQAKIELIDQLDKKLTDYWDSRTEPGERILALSVDFGDVRQWVTELRGENNED